MQKSTGQPDSAEAKPSMASTENIEDAINLTIPEIDTDDFYVIDVDESNKLEEFIEHYDVDNSEGLSAKDIGPYTSLICL